MKLSFFTTQIWVKPAIQREGFSYYTKKERVQAIAYDLLKRIPSYAACYAFVFPFLSGWKSRANFVAIGTGCLALSGLALGICQFDQIGYEKELDERFRKSYKWHEHLCYLVTKVAHAVFHLMTFQITLHEMGHALAGIVLFHGNTPKIEVSLFQGLTTTSTAKLSPIAQKIGYQKALLILAAAGIAMEMIYNLGMLFLAHYSKDLDYANDLYARVSVNILASVSYALTALWQTNASNDFLSIRNLGEIHPLISVVILIAIPVLFKLSLVMIDRLSEKWSIQDRTPQPKLFLAA